jgi:predicted RNase H-like HicB family nuclease
LEGVVVSINRRVPPYTFVISFESSTYNAAGALVEPDRPRRREVVALDRPRRPPARAPRSDFATVVLVSASLQVTILYEQGEDGWIVASIPEVPGANSQGRTRDEARANVIDALRGILELRFGAHPEVGEGTDSEPLELVIGA